MKTRWIVVLPILVFLLPSGGLFAQSDVESAKTSVVKIETKYSVKNKNGQLEKKAGTATGFCWQNAMYVVTALHAVAGVDEIKVIKNDGKYTTAKVVRVLLEADLALLQLTATLGLKPLALAEVNPNAGKSYTIWGFPHAVYKIQDNEVRLSRSLESTPILNDIIHGDDLKYQLEKQKYPSTKAKILKIGSTIQPGQSGAPLFTSDGRVVGIADGGLRGGTALLNWGMPAAFYLPALPNSGDMIPQTVSLQSNLYSIHTTIPENATSDEVAVIIEQEAAENTISIGDQSITKTWTAEFADIISTMSDEEKAEIMAIVNGFGVDMFDTQYDIYEDFETGATVSIPAGENFEVSDGWYSTCNSEGTLCYSILPYFSGTYPDAKTHAMDLFIQSFPETAWVYNESTPDQMAEIDESEMAGFTFTRYSTTVEGLVLEFTAEISGPDLLIAFLIYDVNQIERQDYRKQYLHFSLAMALRDFASY